MKVRDVMTRDPISVEPTTPVTEAAKIMRSKDIGALPVCSKGRCVGIVTDRDMVIRVVALERDLRAATISECMTTPVKSIHPGLHLHEAAEVMVDFQVRRLPVIEHDELVGFITAADIAAALPEDMKVHALLGQIGRHPHRRAVA